MCAFRSSPHTLLISLMLQQSNRFLDSNQVCMRRELTICNDTCWARRVTEWWWRKALCSSCSRCLHLLHVLRVHRVCEQRNGESAFPYVDNDWRWVCEIQCSRTMAVLWSLSDDTTLNGFGRTLWFKLFPSIYHLSMEHSVDGTVFDHNGPSLLDVTNDQDLWGDAYLDPSFVEYD